MSRSIAPVLPAAAGRRAVLMQGLLASVTAGAVAALVAVVVMPISSEDLGLLAVYVGGASLVGIALGWLLLAGLDAVLRPPLAVRLLAATLVGTLVALGNVWLVASLMFINTAHDLRLLVALLLAGAAITMFFSVGAAIATSRRLDAIARAIGRLASHDYATPATLDARAGGETARLAADVDRLRERLAEIDAAREALDADRRYFTAAISHDLRTPVATIRALVDALDDGVVSGAGDITDSYRRIRQETQRLTRMIDDLRELAEIDAGALRLDLSSVPVQEVAAEIVEAMQPVAERSGVELALRVTGNPDALMLDATRMERVIANLVRNALEHSEAGGRVEVEVATSDGGTVVAVSDTGRGLGDVDLDRIWDRFYRAEPSRRRGGIDGGGSGLGLAIVRGFVEAHGGTVAAVPASMGGARFEVRLPANAVS